MARTLLLGLMLAAWAPLAVAAAAESEPPASADAALADLVRETLEKSPEYARARAEAAAERERAGRAGAFPDPTLSLGIQNDGFDAIRIGEMETSFWQLMVTQPIPWPGKRGRREEAARAQASAVEARLGRIELSLTAEVERGYLDLRLARGQLELLSSLESLWREAEATVRARYEVGAVPQSDLLRAQLERTRLAQRRIGLEVVERTAVQVLNRLRVRPLDEPIAGVRRLADAPAPALPPADEAAADAERRSPDLVSARRSVAAAERGVASARQERWPDLTVSAGVMPRGSLDPMWAASVGITLPLFSRKGRAVSEGEERRSAELRGEEATRQVVALRARERHAALEAALRTVQLYREGLLVQSEATIQSTLSQYRVGRVPFAAVLDVVRGLVADQGGYLQAQADAERVAIAMREVSLDAPPGAGGGGGLQGGGGMPGTAGAAGGGVAASGGRSSPAVGGAEAPAPAGGQPSGGMGGM